MLSVCMGYNCCLTSQWTVFWKLFSKYFRYMVQQPFFYFIKNKIWSSNTYNTMLFITHRSQLKQAFTLGYIFYIISEFKKFSVFCSFPKYFHLFSNLDLCQNIWKKFLSWGSSQRNLWLSEESKREEWPLFFIWPWEWTQNLIYSHYWQ